jgi:hypothetical protein
MAKNVTVPEGKKVAELPLAILRDDSAKTMFAECEKLLKTADYVWLDQTKKKNLWSKESHAICVADVKSTLFANARYQARVSEGILEKPGSGAGAGAGAGAGKKASTTFEVIGNSVVFKAEHLSAVYEVDTRLWTIKAGLSTYSKILSNLDSALAAHDFTSAFKGLGETVGGLPVEIGFGYLTYKSNKSDLTAATVDIKTAMFTTEDYDGLQALKVNPSLIVSLPSKSAIPALTVKYPAPAPVSTEKAPDA